MSKEEIIKKLIELGYEAKICEDGCIDVNADVTEFQKIHKIFKELNYGGSYGVRMFN